MYNVQTLLNLVIQLMLVNNCVVESHSSDFFSHCVHLFLSHYVYTYYPQRFILLFLYVDGGIEVLESISDDELECFSDRDGDM